MITKTFKIKANTFRKLEDPFDVSCRCTRTNWMMRTLNLRGTVFSIRGRNRVLSFDGEKHYED